MLLIQQSLVEREVRVQSPTENNIPSVQPVDNTKEIEAKLELEKAKKAAIEELENYKKEYNYSNLSDRDTTVYEYTKAINDAKDTSDVDRILIDAKDAIDKLVKEDLTKFIDAAIKTIENYKTEDEKYIKDITIEKATGIEELEDIKVKDLSDIDLENIKNEIEKVVEVTNGNIDNIILNKTFKVTFIGKTSRIEETVKYKDAAVAPTTNEFVNPVYKDVTYNLTGWDNDFSEVKSNLTINAEYKISKIVAHLYLNEDVMPNPKDKNAKKYSKLGSYELKTDNEVLNAAILADKNKTVYTNDNEIDIKSLFKD